VFTGLIREMAKVVSFKNNFLTLHANYNPKIGDSIAINGACLTVVKVSSDTFTVELSPESTKNSLQWKTIKMKYTWNLL